MKKNSKTFLIPILIFPLIFIVSTTFNTISKANYRKENNVQKLAVASNLFSLKNGRFPLNLDELLSSEGITTIGDDVSNYHYELIENGNNCRITVKLLFNGSYSANCSQE